MKGLAFGLALVSELLYEFPSNWGLGCRVSLGFRLLGLGFRVVFSQPGFSGLGGFSEVASSLGTGK